jgi:4-hydroxybenzoyl-CoA thioesterase
LRAAGAGGIVAAMIVYRRSVRFEEVDAARILFFARFFSFAHEAMENFFGALPDGGYVGLITRREIGLPAVKIDSAFHAPLRYGDAVDIETGVMRLGNRSAALGYRFKKVDGGVLAAQITHTVVTTDLRTLRPCDMPDDVRAHLIAHRE